MKTTTILSAVLLLCTTSAFAELSGEDLEKIRTLVKEEVSEVEARLTDKIDLSEKHLKEYVTLEIGKVNIKIGEMDRRLTGEISNMDKRLDQTFTLVVVLITAVIAVVGVPMTIILFQLSRQDKKQRSQDEKIEALQQELAEQSQGNIITPQ